MLQIRLFGSIEVLVEGAGSLDIRSKKGRWLLALLALRLGRRISREGLAEALWPDQDGVTARAYLRQTLTELRHALGGYAACLRATDKEGLSLDPEYLTVDVDRFDRLLASDPEAAVELYAGRLLAGCEEPWAIEARRTREEAVIQALHPLARCAPHERAVQYWRQVLTIDPYRETAVQGLMQALSALGEEAGSLKVYREFQLLLHRELNAEPSKATTAIYEEQRRSQTRLTAPEKPAAKVLYRLPSPLTQLVGRAGELDRIFALLGQTRLLTLTGPGGSGKTRLAIQAAHNARNDYAAGVWFVDLAQSNDGALISQRIGETLGLAEQAGTAWESVLLRALGPLQILIVLDNCEHVIEEGARLAARLLQECPALSILATSREALDISGEHRFPVPSLALPPPGLSDVSMCEAYSSVELFTARAKERHPEFELDAGNAEAIAEICRRLDGMPLAIEMAAARIAQMPAAVLLSRLDDRFAVLRNWSRTVAPRQRTLDGMIDWSYRLLSADEQTFLNRLSVFAGDWSAEAAASVAAFEPIQTGQTGDLLETLVAKNLLGAIWQGDHARYRLLETVSQFGARRLAESGEAETVDRRHFEFYCAIAQEGQGWRMGVTEQVWARRCDAEYPNLRRAAEWSLDTDPVLALRIVAGLSRFWSRHCRNVVEGMAMVRRALALPVPDSALPDRFEIIFRCYAMLHWGGHEVEPYLDGAIAMARERGDTGWLACLLGELATCLQEDPDRAKELLEEALRIGVPGHPVDRPQEWLRWLAIIATDPAKKDFYLNRALELSRAAGDLETAAHVYLNKGHQDPEWPDPEALKYADAAEEIFLRLGPRTGSNWVDRYRAVAALGRNDYASASHEFFRLADDSRRTGHVAVEFFTRLIAAESLDSAGNKAEASDQMDAAEAILHSELLNFKSRPSQYVRMIRSILEGQFEEATRLYGETSLAARLSRNERYEMQVCRSRARFHGIRALGLARFEQLAEEGARACLRA